MTSYLVGEAFSYPHDLCYLSSLAIDRLKSADDAFRGQLENKVQAFQEQINQLEHDKQTEIDQANLRVCTDFRLMQVKSIAECSEHSAILSTFIKLPFVNKIFVLSIFEWPHKTGFTVFVNCVLVYNFETDRDNCHKLVT